MWRRRRALGSLDDDIRDHLEREVEEHLAHGVTREEAQRLARVKFGNPALVREDARASWGWVWVEQAVQDLRYAARALRLAPAFTVTCVGSLTLGIGAATAVFSLVNAALLKPLPYPEPHRLVVLTRGEGASAQSGQLFDFLRTRVATVEAVAAQSLGTSFNLLAAETAVHVTGLRVSTDYFRAHGVRLLLGRELLAGEDTPGGPDVAILSEPLWRRVFDGRPTVLGESIRLGGRPHVVVGVAPASFESIPAADVLVPLRTTARDTGTNYRVFGRLRADASAAGMQTELDTLRADLIRQLPGVDERSVPQFAWMPYRDLLGRGVRQPLFLLLGAVGIFLVIACVNVASLHVARATARRRELATYAALGAGGLRIARRLFSEALLLGVVSSLLGLGLAAGGTRVLYGLVSEDFARELLAGATLGLDWRVLLATTVLAVGAALASGLAPVAILRRFDLRSSLADGNRATGGRETTRLRRGLAVAEIALALVLLVGAGLLVRSFVNLTRVDLGFDPSDVVVGRMSLQGTPAEETARRAVLFEQVLERLRQVPGVEHAAASNHVPVESGLNLPLLPPAGGLIDRTQAIDWRYITPDFFTVFGIALRGGRSFTDADGSTGRPVAIVNQAFARTYFGRVDVVGETVELALQDAPREIIGVVHDVKARSNSGFGGGLNALAAATAPAVYVPAAQAPDAAVQAAHRFFEMKWAVKTRGPVPTVERDMREAMQAADPTLPFIGFTSMEAVIARDLDLQRLLMAVLTAFALVAVLLAALGLGGLIAYTVAQRRSEIGLRMALGATRPLIARAFIGDGLSIAGVGIGIGACGALALTRLFESQLYGVAAFDTITVLATGVLLLAVTVGATLVPSMAAARTDPSEALRAD